MPKLIVCKKFILVLWF